MINIADFSINFNLQDFRKNIVTTPFKIVFQTSDKKLEKIVAAKWPDLVKVTSAYNMQQLKRLQYMKAFINKHLDKSSIDDIHAYFYQRHWIEPLKRKENLTTIILTNFDAKHWLDKPEPYFEIEGHVVWGATAMILSEFLEIVAPIQTDLKLGQA